MKRKIICSMIAALLCVSGVSQAAQTDNYSMAENIVSSVVGRADDTQYIKRGDAVNAIMRAVGMSVSGASLYSKMNFYTHWAKDTFAWGSEGKALWCIKDAYMYYAYSSGIIKGCTSGGSVYIAPDNNITLNEAETIMARCAALDAPDIEISGINKELKLGEFKTMLAAFLDRPAVMYFDAGGTEIKRDEQGSETYALRLIKSRSCSEAEAENGIRTITNAYGVRLYSIRDIAEAYGVSIDWTDGTVTLSSGGKQLVLKTDNKEPHIIAIDDSIYESTDKGSTYIGEYVNHNGSIYVYHNNKANDTYDILVSALKTLTEP